MPSNGKNATNFFPYLIYSSLFIPDRHLTALFVNLFLSNFLWYTACMTKKFFPWTKISLSYIHRKNDFAEVSENLAIDLKIIFWILKILYKMLKLITRISQFVLRYYLSCLSFLQNYFNTATNYFQIYIYLKYLYISKFLNISAESFLPIIKLQ